MPWYSIFENETGRLLSIASEPVSLPAKFGYIETEEHPEVRQWDAVMRQYVAPVVDPVDPVAIIPEEEAAAVEPVVPSKRFGRLGL